MSVSHRIYRVFRNACPTCGEWLKIPENSEISSILSHIQHIPTHTLYWSMSYSEEDDSDNNTEGPLVEDEEDEVSDQQSNDDDALSNREFSTID